MARKPNNRRYQAMQGRVPGLGEHEGDPRRYVTEPGVAEDAELLKGLFRSKRASSPSRQRALDPIEVIREYGMRTVRTIEMGARMIDISPRYISNTKSLRVDAGLQSRKDILIVNMSAQVIWVNTRPMISTNDGFPLGPISAAGKYDGGSLSVDATSDVYWYAIAAAGVNQQIIVVESAR